MWALLPSVPTAVKCQHVAPASEQQEKKQSGNNLCQETKTNCSCAQQHNASEFNYEVKLLPVPALALLLQMLE